ncbi:MAG: BspA family leucine-rich repeat surface protein [Clostridia bacterium]|nr:BspA family leucine-rich repeat surface protein [Clostridia bacterium]
MKHIHEFLINKRINKKIDSKTPAKYKATTYEDLQDAILECFNDNNPNLNCIDVSNITKMSNLFKDINDLHPRLSYDIWRKLDMSEWDTSNVRSMYSMFDGCKHFDGDVSNWDVTKVDNMDAMFYNCDEFKGKGLSTWDVSNVKQMGHMFCMNQNLDDKEIEDWKIDSVADVECMFAGCQAFNPDLSKWKLPKTLTYLNSMFEDCGAFEGKGLENWDVSNIETMYETFSNCINFNPDLSNWNTYNLVNINQAFYNCISFDGKGLENWNVKKLKQAEQAFQDCEYFNPDLSNWNIFTSKDSTFYINVNVRWMFRGCSRFNCNLNNWDFSNVSENQYEHIFSDTSMKRKNMPKNMKL